ncbi:MAG TPA: methyltransferase, partial [Pirellulales bacterium]
MTASPSDQFRRMLTGYWISQSLYVAAKLGLADLVKNGPRSDEDLAKATGTHAPSLYRLLRALASVGVFAEEHDRRFGLTPLAECLRSDTAGSQRSLAIMLGEEHFACYGRLIDSVRTGETMFDKIYGSGVFDFLSTHPEQGRTFDEAMVGVHGEETAAMLDAYDFSGIGTLADVGGGNGSLLRATLEKNSQLRGMLVDLPNVVARAKANFTAAGLTDRCQAVAGNFFESVPGGADA